MGFSTLINNRATAIAYSIDSFFDQNYQEPERSPIDNYFEKTDDLNKLFTYHDSSMLSQPPISTFPNETLHNLILLGYVSAVESFFRELIRKLVIIDNHSSKHCEKHDLKYGAALLHTKELMPEALLEGVSFASSANIASSLKNFLDIKSIFNHSNIKDATDKFQDICQLRHILIHRYGKLGIENLIKLRSHSIEDCLEKPLELNAAKLYQINVICNNLILEFNQFIFDSTLERTAQPSSDIWQWDYRKDRKTFLKYISIFHSDSNPPSGGTRLPLDVYTDLRDYGRTLI
tara:strand:+ start:2128 stop:2997 length:870 start_codon:yes stop_codon:yes gene_type:complete